MASIAREMGAPIPGQSLTREPGASPWEKPPQFHDVDDAMEFLFTQITDVDHAHQVLALIEAGMPLTVIVGTILQGGFMEGKWTPDIAVLLTEPLTHLLIKMCNMYEIEYEVGSKKSEFDTAFMQLAGTKAKKQDTVEADKAADEAVARLGGLMGPRGIK
jgi:hypothetical protein